MSAYVIVGRETTQVVAACLREHGMAETPIRIAEKGQGVTALDEAARVPANLLLLDVNTGPGLGSAVLRYRLSRRDTRIVLLAPGKVPGDAEVAAVVQSGVYDVVTDLEDLSIVLGRPPADLDAAALWLDPALAPGTGSKEPMKKRVIERRVAVSQRPVLVAVAGTAEGVGTTIVSCALAGYLSRWCHHVVLVESGKQPSLAVITNMELNQTPMQWHAGLDVCIDPAPRNLVRARQHAYVVADLGAYPRKELEQVDADLVLAVLPPTHRLIRALNWLGSTIVGADLPRGVRYVVTGNTIKEGKRAAVTWQAVLAEMAGTGEGNAAQVSPMPVGSEREWPPGYRRRNDEVDRACAEILADILPDLPRKTGRPWLPFGRKCKLDAR